MTAKYFKDLLIVKNGSQVERRIISPVLVEKLKQKARLLKRTEKIKYNLALERVVQGLPGIQNWHQIIEGAKDSELLFTALHEACVIAVALLERQLISELHDGSRRKECTH